jgi:tripartite-type tricarboxylate transporter receptor subunit TctC
MKITSVILIIFVSLTLFGCEGTTNNINISDKDIQDKARDKDNFPNKSIQIVVPFAPGGGTDAVARALSDSAKKYFRMPVAVVNKTGDGGLVGMVEGANSVPDGYTVTMLTVELSILPHIRKVPINYQEFRPIIQVNEDPAALTVKADASWDTIEEFIEYTKKNPNQIRVGTPGLGTIWHIAAAEIENKAGIVFQHVPYEEGSAPAVVDLLGGYIDAVTVSPAEVMPHVRNGELKVLGVMSYNRIKTLPDVPTFREKSYDISLGTWRGLGVPKNTPNEIVEILKSGFYKAAVDRDFVEIINKLELGYKVADADEFLKLMKENNSQFMQLIRELNIISDTSYSN